MHGTAVTAREKTLVLFFALLALVFSGNVDNNDKTGAMQKPKHSNVAIVSKLAVASCFCHDETLVVVSGLLLIQKS